MNPPITTITLNPAVDQTVAIPDFLPDTVNRVLWEQADAGGKGVNVASFLADVGFSVSVTGFLGKENPQLFDSLFHQKKIHDHFVRVPGKTRVNIKIVDDVAHQVTDINFPGVTVQEGDVRRLQDAIAALAHHDHWFVFSGSLPEGVSTQIYHDLIVPLKHHGKTVILDTSGDALRYALPAKPDLIKPNLSELRDLLGQPLEDETAIVTAARELIAAGIPRIVVSMGAAGALFIDAHTAVHAQPPKVEVKSTVGAGDAMVAGTVAGLAQGLPFTDCAALGTAFSIGALSQIGPRLPPREELEANRHRVRVRRVEGF